MLVRRSKYAEVSSHTESSTPSAKVTPIMVSKIHQHLPALYNPGMPISARNKLRGKIEEIQLGDIMAHVVVRVGDNLIESAITRRSADELKLKKGDTVTAVVKATEVMIQKD